MGRKNKKQYIFGLIVVFVMALFFVLFLQRNYFRQNSNSYSNRLFNESDNFVSDIKYPSALISVSEKELNEIRCTKDQEDIEGKFLNKINSVINAEILKRSVSPENYIVCETQNDGLIAQVSTVNNFGLSDVIFFVYLEGEQARIVALNNFYSGYGFCNKPLMFTENQDLFYRCVGAEGGSRSERIYKISFRESTAELIYECLIMPGEVSEVVSCV